MSASHGLRLFAPIGFTLAIAGFAYAGQRAEPGAPPLTREQRDAPRVLIRDGRVSATVENVRLDLLLDEVARLADVALVRDDVPGDERVSADFKDLAIDEVLRQLLATRDAFFFYGGSEDRPASLRVVWIYGPGKGRGLVPVPPDAWASTRDVEDRLRDADPDVRAAAIETLIERKKGRSLDAVLRALHDADERVRTRALYAALAGELEVPADALREALTDASANVRFLALDALAQHSDFAAIARRALQDSSEHVRARAAELLAARDRASRPRQSPAPQRPPKR